MPNVTKIFDENAIKFYSTWREKYSNVLQTHIVIVSGVVFLIILETDARRATPKTLIHVF